MGVEGDDGGAHQSSKAEMQSLRAGSPGGGEQYLLPSLYTLSEFLFLFHHSLSHSH